jgi:hypothetical protein
LREGWCRVSFVCLEGDDVVLGGPHADHRLEWLIVIAIGGVGDFDDYAAVQRE